MIRKTTSLAKRKKDLSLGRLLCIERLEPRQCMDASTELSLSIQPDEDSSQLSTLQAPANKLVEYRIRLTDMFGKPIDSVRVDDEFMIKIYVRDLRDLPPNSLRLFSAYADLFLDPKLFVPTGEGKLGDDFWEYKGQIDFRDTSNSLPVRTSSQIGGVVTARYPNGSGHLLFEIPVKTVAEGEGTIATSPVKSEASLLYQTALYGSDSPLLDDSINFDKLPVSVLPKLNQAPNEVQLPTSPVPPALQTPESNSPQPIVSQPGTAPPTTTRPLIETSVTTRPTPKVAVDPRQLASKNEVAGDQQDLQNPIASDSKLGQAQQIHRNDVLKAEIMRTLIELASSRASIFIAAQRLSMYESLTFFSYTPLQKLLAGPSQLLNGISPFVASSVLHRFGNRHVQSQAWVASELIDRMLEQLETGSSLQAKSFEWEATYSRVAMRRLPFQASLNKYVCDEFADVDMELTSADILESREQFITQATIEGLVSSNRTEELGFAYKRSSMKTLPLMDRETASADPGVLVSELNSRMAQTSETSNDEPFERSSSSDWVQQSRTGANHFLIVVTSFYILLRCRFRKLLHGHSIASSSKLSSSITQRHNAD